MNENPIQNAKVDKDSYITWGDDLESRQLAIAQINSNVEEYIGLNRGRYVTNASGRYGNTRNLAPGVHGRPGYTKDDYYAFRPDEKPASSHKSILSQCDSVYESVGIINHIINLMGEFGCQGIKITHPIKKHEKFLQYWFEKVGGKERSERFLNCLYRLGVVIIRKQTAKLTFRAAEQLYHTSSAPDLDVNDIKKNHPVTREVPWVYTFLNPKHVIVIGDELSSFVGSKKYAIDLPSNLKIKITNPKTEAEAALVKMLPKEIIQCAKQNKPYLLPEDKTLVFHYKKDDWKPFALPMIYPILDDVALLEKLKLADMSALDGAISNIRIFKLGRIADKIAPSKAAAAKLADILSSHTGAGTIDLIWGDDISIEETKTEVYRFLGKTKYEPTYTAIHSGLGVPPILTGSTTGATNNMMTLKTLAERLQYGRDRLIEFWSGELAAVCDAMGYRFPANIEFDMMTLADEQAMKALCIQMVDRNLMSEEQVQTIFKQNPDMERVRLKREQKYRKTGKMVRKAGPWNDPEYEESLYKIALQSGAVTPSQVGLELMPKKKGEEPALKMKTKKKSDNLSGIPQQGRPKNSKDTKKRKAKTYKPRSSTNAMMQLWAEDAQNKIADIINPMMLKVYNRKNVRSMTDAEAKETENLKFSILMNLEPFVDLTQDYIQTVVEENKGIPKGVLILYKDSVAKLEEVLKREPTLDEKRRVQAYIYSIKKGNENE